MKAFVIAITLALSPTLAHAAVPDSLRVTCPFENDSSRDCLGTVNAGPCVDLARGILLGSRSDVCATDPETDEHEVMNFDAHGLEGQRIAFPVPFSDGVWWCRITWEDDSGNRACVSQKAVMVDARPAYRRLLARSRARLANEANARKWGPPRW